MFIEYCEGGAVDSIMLNLDKPLTEPQIQYICKEMCDALQFLHSHYVIHRDIKAGNVLLTAEGCVRIGKLLAAYYAVCGYFLCTSWKTDVNVTQLIMASEDNELGVTWSPTSSMTWHLNNNVLLLLLGLILL